VGIYAYSTDWIGAPEGVDHRVKPGDDDFNREIWHADP